MRLRLWLLLLAFSAGLAALPARAQQAGVTGLWLVSDKDAIIEIAPCGALMCGRIVWLKEPLKPDGTVKRDEHNSDPALRNRPICGLPLMWQFKQAGPAKWEEGRIYDPTDGSVYHAEMQLDGPDTLRLRGYVLMPLLGQSRVWTRVPANSPRCPQLSQP